MEKGTLQRWRLYAHQNDQPEQNPAEPLRTRSTASLTFLSTFAIARAQSGKTRSVTRAATVFPLKLLDRSSTRGNKWDAVERVLTSLQTFL
jgi:hypothetical protein